MTSYSQILTEQIQLNDSYGKSNEISVYIYDTVNSQWVEVEGIEYFKVEKRLNQMSKFEITMPQIEADQKLYVKEYAKVLLISNNVLILKGRIQKVNYETSYSATIEGFGMEAVILDKEYKNIIRSPNDEDRVQYTNVSAQTIAKELLSINADGTSPWTMQPRTYGLFAIDYGLISMRYEYANKLTALGNLANSLNYDWWIDHDPISYTNDYFNMASIKGNQTAPDINRQFTITGDNVNAEGTDYQKDITNIANYLKIIGYGDGINQLFTSTYNASPIWNTLSANISDIAVTIPLIDSSAFAASGTVRIANEIIIYTGNAGNSLTGCTRGTSGTTAKIHRNGCYIEKYIVYTSPEANSSISDNGLMELTLTYRDIRDESTLELIASNELIDRMNPIERITITPTDPNLVAETLQTGDLVSVIDAESSLNSNYRIVAIIYENNYGILSVTLEASNKSLTFIEQMQKEREKNQSLQKYMQGSTNVYVVNNSENCDNGYGCIIKTFIPPEAIAINHVMLSYDVSAYRIYNTTTANESAHTHGIPSLTVNSTTTQSDTSASGGGSHFHYITTLPGHQHLMFLWNSYPYVKPQMDKWLCSRSAMSLGTTAYFYSDNNYNIYTDQEAINYTGDTKTTSTRSIDHTHIIPSLTVSGTTTIANTSSAGSAHNHGISYGISTGSNTITDMQIYIDGTERTTEIETQIGHTLSINSTESEIDLTSWITTVGWHTIDIRPNGTCRISGDMWNQIFIESK
jgi:hypothetical protein